MRGTWIGLALVALVGGSAAASPLKVHNGSSVRVALKGKREMGVGLKPRGNGWTLELAAGPDEVADVFDVTDGANGAKWSIEVLDGAVFFDDERFIAGHAYRVIVRHGAEALGATLVYLYPPPAMAARHKVTFDDADTSGAGGNDIAIAKKPTL